MQKVVWIVNEYNFPDIVNTRQSILCRLLNEKEYDAYILSGSAENKGGDNRLSKRERIRFVQTSEAKGYIIHTSSYRRSFERVLVSLQFQFRLWKYRGRLPKPDVIVSDFAGLFGFVFLRWKRKYGTKIIYDVLDLWPEGFVDMGYIKSNSLVAKLLYALEHKTYKKANGLIFSFEGGRDYIIDKGWSADNGGDVDTSNIGYLNNGVDLSVIDAQQNEYILEDKDLDSEKMKVVYLGSISSFNGLDIILEVAKKLQDRQNNDFLFLIYGYGNQEERLKRCAEEYHLSNVIFKGKLDKRYAMNLLSRSDINLFTFVDTPLLKYGVSPNKLFMYFASGKPVLSLIRPRYDLVEGRKCGISVNNNVNDIVEALYRFKSMNEKEYEEYCRNARLTAEEFDYSNLVQVLIDRIEG